MFTDEQKFIVKAFGRNTSPTKVRQEFLRGYTIGEGRSTAKYKLYHFCRVNKEFEKHGSIVHKQVARTKTKRTEAKKEEVERLLAKRPFLSLRQAAPNAAISMSTLHRILKCDLKHKFYHTISVQRLQETTTSVLPVATRPR